MPGAALDAQSILRLARRVNSTRIRVEPDTSSPVDDDVRAGRWPRLRVGVDKARHAVRALDALDHRIMLSRRVRRLCPSTGHMPDVGDTARSARHTLFPKFRSAQLLRQHNQTPARCPVEVEASGAHAARCPTGALCARTRSYCTLPVDSHHVGRCSYVRTTVFTVNSSRLTSRNVPDSLDAHGHRSLCRLLVHSTIPRIALNADAL